MKRKKQPPAFSAIKKYCIPEYYDRIEEIGDIGELNLNYKTGAEIKKLQEEDCKWLDDCGEYLGKGVGRYVFVSKSDPNTVIKIENANWDWPLQNWREVNVARELQKNENAPIRRWFAPITEWSETNFAIRQRRVDCLFPALEMEEGDSAYFDLPAVFTVLPDLHNDNYGWCPENDSPVIRDIGLFRRPDLINSKNLSKLAVCRISCDGTDLAPLPCEKEAEEIRDFAYYAICARM